MEKKIEFEWDDIKEAMNIKKHGVSFTLAQLAFFDNNRLIYKDLTHSRDNEIRYFCFGKVAEGVLTVRFTYRKKIRIFGAGYWRKGKNIYEKENKI